MRIRPTYLRGLLGLVITLSASLAHAEQSGPAIRYIAAITNPFLNESPYITTEMRPLYMYTRIPKSFSVSNGGSIQVAAVQLRYAIDERLGVIVTKNGYADARFKELFPDDAGSLNVAAGLKYALIAEPEHSTYLTVGGRYEFPSGDIKSGQISLQGGGNGMLNLFTSFASHVGRATGFQASAGFNLALDRSHDSSFFHSSFHVDHQVVDKWFAVVEGNLLTTIHQGRRTPANPDAQLGSFEGYDLFNFGSRSSGTVSTLGLGARYRLNDHLQFGTAFEIPVSNRIDLIDYRLIADMTYQVGG